MGKKQVEPPMEGAPLWITTFVDMISLLVCFFILLFTFTSMDAYDSFTHRKNFLGTLGIVKTHKGESATDPLPLDIMSAMDIARGAQIPHSRPPNAVAENMEEMGQRLTKEHIEMDLKDIAEGIAIDFDRRGSFAPGSIKINSTLKKSLVELARVLEHYPHKILLEGFTDSEFKPTGRYPTAEALALARALAAAAVMIENSGLASEAVQVAGVGASRARNENATAGERTENRRVEVRILSLERSRAAKLDWKDGKSW